MAEPNRFMDHFYQNLKKEIISTIHKLVHYIKKMESFVTHLTEFLVEDAYILLWKK